MKRILLVSAVVLVLVYGWAATSSAQWVFGRFSGNGTHTLLVNGQFIQRYQATAIRDLNNPATCVLVIYDTLKDTITQSTVDAGSCR